MELSRTVEKDGMPAMTFRSPCDGSSIERGRETDERRGWETQNRHAVAPDNTDQKQTRWRPGESGNPGGRPKGSRNKLGEDFLSAFSKDFALHGAGVIEIVRCERPHDYLRFAVSILPKQIDGEEDRPRCLREYSNEELMTLVANGWEAAIEKILEARGHAPLTPAEREDLRKSGG